MVDLIANWQRAIRAPSVHFHFYNVWDWHSVEKETILGRLFEWTVFPSFLLALLGEKIAFV